MSGPRIQPRWTTTRRHRIHARIAEPPAATGVSVVLVHGLGVSSRYMLPTLRVLGAHFSVHAPDLPGFGLSDKPSEILDVPALADALVDWLAACGLSRVALLGSSFGCQVIAEMAVRHPACVERAVLQGPTVDRTARSMLTQIRRLAIDATREPLSGLFVIGRDYLDCGPRRLFSTLRHALRDRIEDKLRHITMPVLVVRGSRDPIVPHRWAHDVARGLPRSRLVVIPGAAHAMPYAAPVALGRVVRAFLRERS